MDEQENIKSLNQMIDSCFTYGVAGKDTLNYRTYILPYQKRLGKRLFNKTYKQRLKYLEGFEVKQNTYQDSEGLTYNSLVRKEK